MSLTTKRLGHSAEVIGSYLYVFGGGQLNTIERAQVNDDGTLEAFATVSGVTLASGRTAHTSAVIGDFVYVFGGATAGAPASTSVERAPINPDGSIGSFMIVSGVSLNTPRVAHATAVAGNYVYIVGGAPNGMTFLDSVERAPINADGSLGPFMTLSGVSLQTARRNFTVLARGSYLYAFGGSSASGALDTIERSTINADGSLGAFELSDMKLDGAEFDQAFVVVGNYLYETGGLQTMSMCSVGTETTEYGPVSRAPPSTPMARSSHSSSRDRPGWLRPARLLPRGANHEWIFRRAAEP